jgi:thiaminase/transcriptional activator TenA
MATEPLHKTLWQENQALAEECLAHPFVRGLGDGSLDPEVFKRYVAQDAFFLQAFFSAYALGAVRAVARREVVRRLHRLMGGVLDELKLHESYAESLAIDLGNVRPHPATRAYTDFLLRIAWTTEVGEIMAAMTPCMRLYAYLGQELALGDHFQNPYREWIDTYSSAEFEALAAELESLLDQLAEGTHSVSQAYRYAMRCELDFFSASLDEGRWTLTPSDV